MRMKSKIGILKRAVYTGKYLLDHIHFDTLFKHTYKIEKM